MIEQFAIAITGVCTVFLSQDKRPQLRRWACIVGIIAQPFWLFATWKTAQWGMFILSIVYLVGWCRGFHNFWVCKVDA